MRYKRYYYAFNRINAGANPLANPPLAEVPGPAINLGHLGHWSPAGFFKKLMNGISR